MNKMKRVNVREIIHNIVYRIEKDGGFSHLLINHEVKKHQLSDEDKRLLTNIVYGTTQYRLTLDYYLQPFIKGKKKIDDWVMTLLRISLYQMIFLDRIPIHAVIHEAVEIAKKKGHRGIGSFVNGVLRNIQRKGFPSISEIKDIKKRLSIETSHPTWLINRWLKDYGNEITEKIAQINQQEKPQSIRIQPLKTTREEIIKKLQEINMEVEKSFLSEQGVVIKKGNIFDTALFDEGYVTVQDQTSMLVSELLQIEEDMIVLDACSAPGGKATHIAEKLANTGKVYAFDIHKNKTNLIKNNAKRLGLTNIVVDEADARKLKDKFDENTFDRILLDVPCSGFGVIRSKPDIKYNKTEKDIYNLANIQYDILTAVIPLLKEKGKLIYSTCTLTKAENEHIIKRFLAEHDEYEVDEHFFEQLPPELKSSLGVTEYGIQIFPHTFNTDGFFISRIKKKTK